jgi:hypothetical protein
VSRYAVHGERKRVDNSRCVKGKGWSEVEPSLGCSLANIKIAPMPAPVFHWSTIFGGISLLHKAAREHTEKIAEYKCVD